MKPILLIIAFASWPFLVSNGKDIWKLYDLKGVSVYYTGPGKSEGMVADDRLSEDIIIQMEMIDGKQTWFAKTSYWKSTLIKEQSPKSKFGGIPVEKGSITFIETNSGNTAVFTICLSQKNEDDSFMLLYVANQTDGSVGIRSKLMRGKAKLVLKNDEE